MSPVSVSHPVHGYAQYPVTTHQASFSNVGGTAQLSHSVPSHSTDKN